MSDDEIIDAVRDADLDWHAGFPVGDGENRYAVLCRAVERAARAAAFREAAELCDRWADKWRPDVPVRDRYADGLSSGASEIADALRARGEGGEG